MVQAMIEISDNVNQILNIVKAKYGLKTKSEAIAVAVAKYGEELLEPELRPEFVDKMAEIERQKSIKVDNFSERYMLN